MTPHLSLAVTQNDGIVNTYLFGPLAVLYAKPEGSDTTSVWIAMYGDQTLEEIYDTSFDQAIAGCPGIFIEATGLEPAIPHSYFYNEEENPFYFLCVRPWFSVKPTRVAFRLNRGSELITLPVDQYCGVRITAGLGFELDPRAYAYPKGFDISMTSDGIVWSCSDWEESWYETMDPVIRAINGLDLFPYHEQRGLLDETGTPAVIEVDDIFRFARSNLFHSDGVEAATALTKDSFDLEEAVSVLRESIKQISSLMDDYDQMHPSSDADGE